MKRLLSLAVLAFGLSALAVGQSHYYFDGDQNGDNQGDNGKGKGHDKGGDSLPEPSQAFVISAVALLAGSALIIRSRSKKSNTAVDAKKG